MAEHKPLTEGSLAEDIELVIDPFMGGGGVGVAAKRSGRRFAGCDIKPGAVEFVRERLK